MNLSKVISNLTLLLKSDKDIGLMGLRIIRLFILDSRETTAINLLRNVIKLNGV